MEGQGQGEVGAEAEKAVLSYHPTTPLCVCLKDISGNHASPDALPFFLAAHNHDGGGIVSYGSCLGSLVLDMGTLHLPLEALRLDDRIVYQPSALQIEMSPHMILFESHLCTKVEPARHQQL